MLRAPEQCWGSELHPPRTILSIHYTNLYVSKRGILRMFSVVFHYFMHSHSLRQAKVGRGIDKTFNKGSEASMAFLRVMCASRDYDPCGDGLFFQVKYVPCVNYYACCEETSWQRLCNESTIAQRP